MSDDIVFEAPPPPSGGRGESPRNQKIAEALRAKPGQWARVAQGEKSDSLAVRIRTGKAKSFAKGIWESTSRTAEDGTVDIWARFVGEDDE